MLRLESELDTWPLELTEAKWVTWWPQSFKNDMICYVSYDVRVKLHLVRMSDGLGTPCTNRLKLARYNWRWAWACVLQFETNS